MTRSILIVDDSASARHRVRYMLESRGYAVTEADDGLHGLEACQKNSFDLILVDINMPVMDGLQMS